MYKIYVELTVTVDVINFIQPFISCVLNMIPKLVVSFSRVDWWASFVLYYGLWVYMLTCSGYEILLYAFETPSKTKTSIIAL